MITHYNETGGVQGGYVQSMKTRNKFMTFAGFSLFIILITGAWSLRNVMSAVTSLTAEIEHASREQSTIEAVSAELATLSANIHDFIPDKDNRHREACDASRAAVHRMLDNFIAHDSDANDRHFHDLVHGSFVSAEKTMDRIFSLKDLAGSDSEPARRLLLETDRLVAFMNADIGLFRKDKIDARTTQITARSRALQARVVLPVIMTIFIAVVLLLGFAIFIHRTVSVPLQKLREGVSEFSRGNRDYRLHAQGTDEISLIAGQMNGMADTLTHSLRELEDKLSESANALAAMDRAEIAVRHEINNPLTTVIGNVELLIERYGHKDKDLTARLEVVLNNALRIAETTRRLQQIKKGTIVDQRTDAGMTDVT